MAISTFNDFLNESQKMGFTTELSKDKIDVFGYDKSKYESTDEYSAVIQWSASIDETKSGIEGISVIVNKVVLSISYIPANSEKDDPEPIKEEVVFIADEIETKNGQKIPLFIENLGVDLIKKKAIVSLGQE